MSKRKQHIWILLSLDNKFIGAYGNRDKAVEVQKSYADWAVIRKIELFVDEIS